MSNLELTPKQIKQLAKGKTVMANGTVIGVKDVKMNWKELYRRARAYNYALKSENKRLKKQIAEQLK